MYDIILIGVHRTSEPFTLSNSCHLQYIYYLDQLFSAIDYIAYLPTLRGQHRIFVITTQTCKCTILKLELFWFDLSHQYLYALIIFSFCEICNSELYRVIFGYIITTG